ncbi:MAG TPA: amidase family protein [Solirubrobacterales bacterium]|nr:amidase family protein [Solirubrobacterales bacterium]
MDAADLAFAGIARQAEFLREKEISSAELVELYLERIERINPKLNAFTDVLADEAREAAAAADERIAGGEGGEDAPLLGVPVALKDEIDVEGMVAQHGTSAYSGPPGPEPEHWQRLRSAGAVLLGKTTLPELAICGFTETETWGETRNPWNTEHSVGGSSGGSGAAVAAGLVGAASASDGAGSIRIPAACNGLFGLKPQRDRISLAPLDEHWLGMSATGCLARRVRDTALWMDVAAAEAGGAPPPERSFRAAADHDPGKLRVCWTLSAPRVIAPPHRDPAVEGALRGVVALLGDLGHEVSERDPDWGMVGNDCANRYLKGIEADYDQVPHPERLEARTKGFKRIARVIPDALLRRSLDAESRHATRIGAIFDHCDLLVSPTMATPPVEIGRWAGQGALRTMVGMSRVYPHTITWNYLGWPAASIPAGSSEEGLPLAVQLVAPPGREDLLISLAARLEAELAWPEHRPPLAG